MSLPNMHLFQAAITLAEVRNYSRAARKLRIQQPTLTKWILELEHRIGFPLFRRTTQFVEPTDACRRFVEEAKQCVFHAERALEVARMAERGAQTVLHIGRSQYTDPYLITLLNAITLPLYPDLQLSMSTLPFQELETDVLLGKLDLALTIGDFDHPKITQLELCRSPMFLALPEGSSLAGHEEIKLQDIHQKTWLLFERHIHPTFYDSIVSTLLREGVKPKAIHHIVTAEEAARELYTGLAEVAFLTKAGAWRIARNGLTMRPLRQADLAISDKLIARAEDSSRVVSEFARALKKKLEVRPRLQLDLPLNSTKASREALANRKHSSVST